MSARDVLGQAGRVDTALYEAVAAVDVARLDVAMSRLSRAADHGLLWLAVSGVLGAAGGAWGRRAATDGLASIATTSPVVNAVVKPLARRRRPDRGPELSRHVRMPRSRSFPSGHAASAAAFVTGVGGERPWLALPLRALAGLVGYSRVHTGVHYPGDVLAGSLFGFLLARLTLTLRRR